ncbi:MAG: zinc-binding dehydrogenase [Nonomuraea sp.]|nr:zinc-binding dehydrogenase [Nonomuraea sp.]NUS12489.1 zinc-binding dehydrogenase [Streptomyces sp.]NUS31013.1 zinc-binding dehydrogenase [Streptomyces sp.]NUS78940.1 zinc-binding dehydrogenase [Streptomyces sp.]
MRAAQVQGFGGPEMLVPVDLPDPAPGPGEVLIEVAYADTIFVETQLRTGWGREYFPTTPPYVPGGGVSGVVAAVGPDVDGGWLGRRVVSHVTGSYASKATAAVTSLTPVPAGLDLLTAAALVHDGVTATGLLDLTAVTADDQVLVLGASGGMGTLLVQLARSRGARVTALARGAEKLALVRELGATAAVDITGDGWPGRVREALGGDGADVVLDGVGGQLGAAALALTADGGRFSAHGAPTGGFATVDRAEAERRGIKVFGIGDVQFGPAEVRRLMARALDEAAAGRLRVAIGAVFPVERAGEAHARIEGRGVVGKVVLEV